MPFAGVKNPEVQYLSINTLRVMDYPTYAMAPCKSLLYKGVDKGVLKSKLLTLNICCVARKTDDTTGQSMVLTKACHPLS